MGFLLSFLRLKGENQQLIEYRKKLDELRCWLENVENALDTRFTFDHEENLQELQARLISVCMCMHMHVLCKASECGFWEGNFHIINCQKKCKYYGRRRQVCERTHTGKWHLEMKLDELISMLSSQKLVAIYQKVRNICTTNKM